MIAAILVTVLVDGRPVTGSTPARLHDGVVVAPLAPYLRDIAERIDVGEGGRSIAIAREGRTISIAIGSAMLRSGTASQDLPIAPYLRSGEAVIPLAAVVRALGATADYDGTSKTLSIVWTPGPVLSLAPDVSYTAPPNVRAPFTPNPTPAPKIVVTGIPKPRRTPVLVEAGDL